MQTITAIAIGLGLASACGFRVFIPLLVAGIAARAGMLDLHGHFGWLASWPALIAFGTASLLEAAGYMVPWVDHALDTVATPAAVVAGTVVLASQMGTASPLLNWSAALIAGGGVAGAVQALTVGTRVASTATTGGLGNPVLATAEAGLSTVLSMLAVVAPVVAAVVLGGVVVVLVRRVVRRRRVRSVRA